MASLGCKGVWEIEFLVEAGGHRELEVETEPDSGVSGVGCGFRRVASPENPEASLRLRLRRGAPFSVPGQGLRMAGHTGSEPGAPYEKVPPIPRRGQTQRPRARQGLVQTGQVAFLCVPWPLVK